MLMLSINLTFSNHTATQIVVPSCAVTTGMRLVESTISKYSTVAVVLDLIPASKCSASATDDVSETRAISTICG